MAGTTAGNGQVSMCFSFNNNVQYSSTKCKDADDTFIVPPLCLLVVGEESLLMFQTTLLLLGIYVTAVVKKVRLI